MKKVKESLFAKIIITDILAHARGLMKNQGFNKGGHSLKILGSPALN